MREEKTQIIQFDNVDSSVQAFEVGDYRTALEVFRPKALKGDAKAFELIRDTSGQKPIEKVEQVNIDGEYLDKVNELKAFFNGEEEQRDN